MVGECPSVGRLHSAEGWEGTVRGGGGAEATFLETGMKYAASGWVDPSSKKGTVTSPAWWLGHVNAKVFLSS